MPRPRKITVVLTQAQAEAVRQLANIGVGECEHRIEPQTYAAGQRGLERIVLAMGYKPERIAGRIGFATRDGKGSLY